MARPRSLIVSMEWTQAGRAHDCRNNKDHRVEKGQWRLTVRSDGNDHHYCVRCAKTFLAADIQRLQGLLEQAEREVISGVAV